MIRHKHSKMHDSAFDAALNTLDILRDIDLVMAPLRPTEEMIGAGCLAGNITPMQARLIYEAMIRASIPNMADDDL